MNSDDLELEAKKLLALLRRGMERVSGQQEKINFEVCEHRTWFYDKGMWKCLDCGEFEAWH
jgi:hypothetical protein